MNYTSEPFIINKNAARKAMFKLSREFKRFLRPYWQKERSPIDNKKWIARKDNLPHPILNKTGKMLNQVFFRESNGEIITRMVDYGIFHQFGTEKMPERQWLGLTDEAVEFFIDTYLEEIIK